MAYILPSFFCTICITYFIFLFLLFCFPCDCYFLSLHFFHPLVGIYNFYSVVATLKKQHDTPFIKYKGIQFTFFPEGQLGLKTRKSASRVYSFKPIPVYIEDWEIKVTSHNWTWTRLSWCPRSGTFLNKLELASEAS